MNKPTIEHILLGVIGALVSIVAFFAVQTYSEVRALRTDMTDVRILQSSMSESIVNIKQTLSDKREAREVRQDKVGQ